MESVIVKHLRKLVKITLDGERKEAYLTMKSELEVLFENPVERVLLDYFDVLSWLEAKIQGVTFTEAVGRKKLIAASRM